MKLANVPAEVNKAPMTTSLLGMAFLKRLDSFEVQGRPADAEVEEPVSRSARQEPAAQPPPAARLGSPGTA